MSFVIIMTSPGHQVLDIMNDGVGNIFIRSGGTSSSTDVLNINDSVV